jgi:hypothetical protein
MPEPISTTLGVAISYIALHGYARFGTAVSDEAALVSSSASAIVNAAEGSDVLFGRKAEMLSRLHDILEEHNAADGDSPPADPVAVRTVTDFIVALPDDLPSPDFAVEPDGAIELDWIARRGELFSLSIGNGNRLAYAWLVGMDKAHGVVRFNGTHVPEAICQGIKMVMGIQDVAVGVA